MREKGEPLGREGLRQQLARPPWRRPSDGERSLPVSSPSILNRNISCLGEKSEINNCFVRCNDVKIEPLDNHELPPLSI